MACSDDIRLSSYHPRRSLLGRAQHLDHFVQVRQVQGTATDDFLHLGDPFCISTDIHLRLKLLDDGRCLSCGRIHSSSYFQIRYW